MNINVPQSFSLQSSPAVIKHLDEVKLSCLGPTWQRGYTVSFKKIPQLMSKLMVLMTMCG